MEIGTVDIIMPEGSNIILGYSHFIKTVEDLNEIIKTTIPGAKYSITFSEASGKRLIRHEGNDDALIKAGIENIKNLSCGHTFLIILENAFPISVLNQIKQCQEVGSIYAATANPLKVVIAKEKEGNGILGVIDGSSPLGVETEDDKAERRAFLRSIGYKS